MAKAYNAATRAALAAGNVSFRLLAQFELDDGTYYFGNHSPGELISAVGQNWYGVGGLAQVSDFTTASGLAADEATITVNGVMVMAPPPEYADTASWFRDILTRDMNNRRATIYELILQEDTGAPLHADKMFAGPIERTPLDPTRPEFRISIRSNRQALQWSNGRTRSDADQRRTAANDGSLRHTGNVAARKGKMPWGFIPQQNGTRTGGGGGGGGRSDGGRFNRIF